MTTSFTAGMRDTGGIVISNTSTDDDIVSVAISLDSDTYFDTSVNDPGSVYTEFSVRDSVGDVIASLPDGKSTDGQTTATISFSNFKPGYRIWIDFDIDLLSKGDSATGSLLPGTTVTVTFSSTTELPATISSSSISYTFSGFPYTFQNSFSA